MIKKNKKNEKEVDKNKISKKRMIILFTIIFSFLSVLVIIWGGVKHKNTGLSPRDFNLQSENIIE